MRTKREFHHSVYVVPLDDDVGTLPSIRRRKAHVKRAGFVDQNPFSNQWGQKLRGHPRIEDCPENRKSISSDRNGMWRKIRARTQKGRQTLGSRKCPRSVQA